MNDARIPIICVIGPTASGKSARAIALAKERGGEVISVDSRQVYKTLDIGTEKMTAEEMQGVPHHLIDIREPEETYSAGDFVEDASRLIKNLHEKGAAPILAGGTHYYVDALLSGLPSSTPENEAFRTILDSWSNEEIFAEIQKKDPRRAHDLDPQNRRRLIRALEIIEQHGNVPSRSKNTTYNVEWITLLPERNELRERIQQRLEAALARGLIEEVHQVRERVGDVRLNELGLEYKIIGEYIRGEQDEASLLPTLSSKLFQYAKRQEAWIRKLTSVE